jgi:hypothetical protein
VQLRSGVGHLAALIDHGTILPAAFEYAFWDQRTPEALVHFGSAIVIERGRERPPAELTHQVSAELERTMDALAVDARSRDPARFDVYLSGRAGVGGAYDLAGRLKSWVRGKRFQPEHRVD